MPLIFHLDMNSAKYQPSYLRSTLTRLRGFGYEAIVWEIEDAVRFDCCPEIASPDAVGKNVMRELLDFSSALGFVNIPLLQTASHCAYVLRHPKYQYLSEKPGFLELYCMTRPDSRNFLTRLIAEYLELFDYPEYFHLGADEAWALGRFCDDCREYISYHGAAGLMARQLRPLCDFLLEHNVRPVIWVDMVHRYPDMTGLLDRRVVMADWCYQSDNDIDDPFRAAVDLRKEGFTVWGCGAARSYGDSVFAPRYDLHVQNLCRWLETPLDGFMLTSWSVHLFPFEVQYPIIARPHYRTASEAEFEERFAGDFLDISGESFFRAVRLLSEPVWLSQTAELGYNQVNQDSPADTLVKALENCEDKELKLAQAVRLLEMYREALGLLRQSESGQPDMTWWILAAQQLILRAETVIEILSPGSGNAEILMAQAKKLRREAEREYRKILLPDTCRRVLDNMFNPLQTLLELK